MSIEGIRERQRLSMKRKTADKMVEEIGMKPENVKKLQSLHAKYWHDSAASLPDGWTNIVAEFLGSMDDLGDLEDAVSLRFERCSDGLRAFAFPEMSRWHPQQMNSLKIAQRNLLHGSRETCEWCGKPAEATKLGDRVTIYLCEEDATIAREKLTAKVEAFDERIRFRGEISILFQDHSNVWLSVSDVNMPIMRKALLDIKKIVEDRGLIGKVFVTKVLESEGQLFISARADQADPASQFEIADIIKNAEWQSDQTQLAANRRALDDDA